MAAPRQFPWELVSQIKDHPTMEKLESTCILGCDHAAKLTDLIRQVNLDDKKSFDPSEAEFLRKCLADKDSLASKYENKHVLVGVSGATGAGKSSLLNALLDIEGLLPSSDSSASTATICEVAYNWDNNPDNAFRCDVFFHDVGDIRRELDDFFRDLHDRQDLIEGGPEDKAGDESEQAREEAIKEADSNIQCVLDKISAIWGSSMILDDLSTDNLLHRDDPAMKFIGAERLTIYGQDIFDFSTKIQPYLDSTKSEIDVQRPEGEAQTMSLWPLIKRVKLFVKADILKCGLVLVDLPGLSDVVGARAQLAEEYYGQLCVTMIVTPIVRGADENTGVGLMTKNQALNMKMDGKFNDKSFCVVLSKADLLDWPKSDPASMPMFKKVMAEGRQLKAEMEKTEKEISRLKKKRGKSKQKPGNDDVRAQIKKATRALSKMRTARKKNQRDAMTKFGMASFKYRQARDKPLFERISRILRQKHDNMRARSRGTTPADFKVPHIFSVGTKAYWDLKSDIYVEGFPDTRYTGIPGLRQWLEEVTVPSREKKTIALLKEYQTFYNSLQTWSDNHLKVERVKLSAEELEKRIVNPMLEDLKKLLKVELIKLRKGIRGCDPFKGYTEAIDICQKDLCKEVEKWARRYPNDMYRLECLNHMTFAAIVRRCGGPFTSRAGGVSTRYHWMKDLATLFNSQIVDNWEQQLHHEIPKEVQKFKKAVDRIWETWQKRFRLAISKNSPGIGANRLAEQSAKLCVIKDKFKNDVSGRVSKFRAESPKMRGNLVDEISTFWKQCFIEADAIPGGPGVTRRKQAALSAFSRLHGQRIFEGPVVVVNQKRNSDIDNLAPVFDHCLTACLSKLSLQTKLFTQRVTQNGTTKDNVKTRKILKKPVKKPVTKPVTKPAEKPVKKTATGKTDTKSTTGNGNGGETSRAKLVAQMREACSEWSKAWCSQDFANLGDRPDESVPREWSFGRELSPIEESESETESEDAGQRRLAIKLEDHDVIIIDDVEDVATAMQVDAKEEDVKEEDVKEGDVVPDIKEEEYDDVERYLEDFED